MEVVINGNFKNYGAFLVNLSTLLKKKKTKIAIRFLAKKRLCCCYNI